VIEAVTIKVVGRARPPGAPSTDRRPVAIGTALPKRKMLPHDLPSWAHPETVIFFITVCCTPRGENQLCKAEVATGIFESVSFRQSRGDWWVQLLLLMPDHLHMLVSFPSDKDMPTVVSQWKEFVAKNLSIRWQQNFFDHRLRTDESLRDKADYILNNPVRRGLIARAEDWSYVWMPDR
jgi:putative transposase